MSPGAIVVGAHVNGLGVIRALAARGVPAVSVSTRPFDIAHHSRWVHERHALPEFHQQHQSLVELLDRHATRWRDWAVFPTNESDILATMRYRRVEQLKFGEWLAPYRKPKVFAVWSLKDPQPRRGYRCDRAGEGRPPGRMPREPDGGHQAMPRRLR